MVAIASRKEEGIIRMIQVRVTSLETGQEDLMVEDLVLMTVRVLEAVRPAIGVDKAVATKTKGRTTQKKIQTLLEQWTKKPRIFGGMRAREHSLMCVRGSIPGLSHTINHKSCKFREFFNQRCDVP
jgi:hypothetical protein